MKSNGCVPLLNMLQKFVTKPQATIYVYLLILTLFCPFNIKISGNLFLGHLGG